MVCLGPELDIFEKRKINAGILASEDLAIRPITSLNASTLEFVSPGQGPKYRDMSSIYLRLRLKLMDDVVKNTELKTDAKDGPINNISSSLFKSVQLFLNNKPVSNIDTCYAYRSYFENLLNFGTEQAAVHLEPAGWSLDNGEFDSITPTKNVGFDKRKEWFKPGKIVECCCKISCDFLNQNRLLLPNVELRLVLTRESPEFYIMSASDSTSSIKIMEATLYVPHVTINPQVLLAHESVLRKQNAIYPYSRIEVKTFVTPPGSKSLSLSNCVIGSLPKLILVAMVETSRFVGDRTLNPFYFKHHNLCEFYAIVNSVAVPAQPIECDFTDPANPICTRAYDMLIRETKNYDRAHQITRKMFAEGCFLLALDLTQDKNYQNHCFNPIRHGTLSLEMKFSTAPTSTLSIILYGEYESQLEFDYSRNVYITY